jgi:erythrin-vacuolar iron transport family protein
MKGALGRTVVQVIVGGALAFAIGLWLGRLVAGGG